MDPRQNLLLILNDFEGINLLLSPPEIIRKPFDFLVISGGIEVD